MQVRTTVGHFLTGCYYATKMKPTKITNMKPSLATATKYLSEEMSLPLFTYFIYLLEYFIYYHSLKYLYTELIIIAIQSLLSIYYTIKTCTILTHIIFLTVGK